MSAYEAWHRFHAETEVAGKQGQLSAEEAQEFTELTESLTKSRELLRSALGEK